MSSICILAIQIEELHIFLICPHHHHRHPLLCKFPGIFFWTNFSWLKLSPFCNSALITSLRWVPLTDNGYSDRWWTGKQAKCICLNYKMYLFKLQNVLVESRSWRDRNLKFGPNFKFRSRQLLLSTKNSQKIYVFYIFQKSLKLTVTKLNSNKFMYFIFSVQTAPVFIVSDFPAPTLLCLPGWWWSWSWSW